MPGFDSLLPRPVSATATGGSRPWPAEVEIENSDAVPAEGYRLDIAESGIRITASDDSGVRYARETLRQLAGPSAFRAADVHSGPMTVPCGTVVDEPRFGWRGCLLDVARNFRTKAEVLRFTDLLAAHKLNVLHLHLTDDQGWRLEVPRFPRLTEIGAWRRGSMVGRHDGPERDGRPHGGFYRTDDLREIVAYAAERGITVVPEVDVPGHVTAALTAYPELGAENSAREVWTSWGVNDDILDPSESTLDFFRAVFDEVLAVFPSEVIAIGGDEVPGATDRHGAFLIELAKYLHERGRRALGWDEVLDAGTLPASAIIGSWRGEEAGVRAAAAGLDVVMCPEQYVYLNHRESDHPDEPIPVGFLNTVEDVHAYEPLPPGLPEDARHRVLGAQAQVWSEHLDTVRRVDYATFPRLCAFSEVVWSPAGDRDTAEFTERLRTHHLPRLDALGVEYRPLDGPLPWQTRPGVPGRPL
ncbi:beta-N-acetylhexosaminidase [Amycolatopsis sp. CA-230715]|uniref:beta-N-acetylhexosaminidase n=1 Tax=Amycolatopsis sp. CA-230715 TaxID=2745196 RepID=UPI001C00F8FD|nr:beta-N-acetylhexosaminidase [Amycolatopsis sp. CA-230715]QWF77180.1 Beta-hexosaminidase [Amycolatopsis sp. CA-230715]